MSDSPLSLTDELLSSDDDAEFGELVEYRSKQTEETTDAFQRFNALSTKYQSLKLELNVLKRRALLQESVNLGLVEPFAVALESLREYAEPLAGLMKRSIQELLKEESMYDDLFKVKKTIDKKK
jgi:hypothetical protein